jgi:hypothetical protein
MNLVFYGGVRMKWVHRGVEGIPPVSMHRGCLRMEVGTNLGSKNSNLHVGIGNSQKPRRWECLNSELV